MVNPQIKNYLKKYHAQGYTFRQLRQQLVKQGYKPADVDTAIKGLKTPLKTYGARAKKPMSKTRPRAGGTRPTGKASRTVNQSARQRKKVASARSKKVSIPKPMNTANTSGSKNIATKRYVNPAQPMQQTPPKTALPGDKLLGMPKKTAMIVLISLAVFVVIMLLILLIF